MNAVDTTDIAIIAPDNLPAVFGSAEKVDEVLERIAAAARAHVPDLTTVTGRKAIASVAHRVARSKTALDEAGKSLTADFREKIGAVDVERRRIREFLDDLKAEVREPLDAWEAAEEKRVAGLEARIAAIADRVDPFSSCAFISSEVERITAIAIDETWQERAAEAAMRKDAVLAALRTSLAAAEKAEAEAAELARLRAEAAAREKAEREAAEAKFRAEMEAAAEEERQRRAAQIERDREEAVARAAEAARISAEREAAAKVVAAQRAQREAEERAAKAVEAERRRAAEERRREEEAEKRRVADVALRSRVKREIESALFGKTSEQIADMLLAGRVPHVRVVL